MAYKVIILYRLYMPSYFLGTFTEYPYPKGIHSWTATSECGSKWCTFKIEKSWQSNFLPAF